MFSFYNMTPVIMKEKPMRKQQFFTSDLHFGHTNIIKYCNRPYSTVDEMNEALIANWNEVVPEENADVYILGDLVMGKFAENIKLIKELNGRKWLVSGNHDRCWPGHKNYFNQIKKYLDAGISGVSQNLLLRLNANPDHNVTLSHFPKRASLGAYDHRYSDYYQTTNQWVLHGHVHDTWKVDFENKQINVGVDVWDYKPVSEETLGQIIDEANAQWRIK